jgi:hypothetical protein
LNGSVDRWPILVSPHFDETLPSWLVRISGRYGVTPREILRACDIPPRAGLADIANALSTQRVASLLAVRWPTTPDKGPGLPPLAGEKLQRFCPLCIAEEPYWRELWAQPWQWACARHKVFYLTGCPRCGQAPWSSNDWRGHMSDVFRCTERVESVERKPSGTRKFCNYDLRSSPTMQASVQVIEAQALARKLGRHGLYKGSLMSVGRMTVRAGQALRAFEQLAGLSSRQEVKVVLQDDSKFVQYLTVASQAWVELASNTAGSTLNQLLGPTGRAFPLGPKSAMKVNELGPILTAAAIKPYAARVKKRTQLAFRVGREWPSAPIEMSGGSTQRLPEHLRSMPAAPAEWIPQALWSNAPDQRTSESSSMQPVVMSLCLLGMGRSSPWSVLALELGLPAHVRFATAVYLHGLSGQRWIRVLEDLEVLLARLAWSPPPINYRARRIVAGAPGVLSDALRSARTAKSTRDIDAVTVAAFWEAFTGGNIEFAPQGLALEAGSTQHADFLLKRRETTNENFEWFSAATRHIGQRVCVAADGPLQWRPP